MKNPVTTMPNYTQVYIHLVFAVKHRQSLIKKEWREELHKYITGIIQNHKHKMLAIMARPDHIHIFFDYHVAQSIPDLVEDIKTSSNHFINKNLNPDSYFSWQRNYGAFSHCRESKKTVINYILNQDAHHEGKSFKKEYLGILEKLEIEYEEKYTFDFFEDETNL
jgi:putative transposase